MNLLILFLGILTAGSLCFYVMWRIAEAEMSLGGWYLLHDPIWVLAGSRKVCAAAAFFVLVTALLILLYIIFRRIKITFSVRIFSDRFHSSQSASFRIVLACALAAVAVLACAFTVREVGSVCRVEERIMMMRKMIEKEKVFIHAFGKIGGGRRDRLFLHQQQGSDGELLRKGQQDSRGRLYIHGRRRACMLS